MKQASQTIRLKTLISIVIPLVVMSAFLILLIITRFSLSDLLDPLLGIMH